MEDIKTLEALYAASEIDESVKTQIREALAFHEAETAKQKEAREARIVKLAANEANPFTLDELRTMSDDMLGKVEKMKPKPQRIKTAHGFGAPEPISANEQDDDDDNAYGWVGGSTIPSQN